MFFWVLSSETARPVGKNIKTHETTLFTVTAMGISNPAGEAKVLSMPVIPTLRFKIFCCSFCFPKHEDQDMIPRKIFFFVVLYDWNIYSDPFISYSQDSVVGIATGNRVDGREVGVRVPVGSRIFSSPQRPDRLWDRPSLLSHGYRGLFPRG
jgi:hypothetical protein